ncbi:hypothetical protein PPERSA_02737 [Pseudocohnilembus persalinus]|uniref:Uncharacterized protein n=1 Tax=Pseudocohnilembus persalinus TaxID=266149 RepID=A0A0V0R7I7_PSEPJ|nr:hypothetical protein PPERSA_02737 [Pseudocohnilembus persalinus]|eukprot:KRX10320.1 hypothetical protein PPERSA_02737 [Pseudocohnilembus persalinus]
MMENSSIQENLRIFKHQNSVYNVNKKSIIQNPSNQNEITQIFTFDPKQTHENIYVYTFTDNNNNQLFLNQYDLQNKSLNHYYQLDNHQLSPQDSDLNFNQKTSNYQDNFINFIDNMQQVTEDVQAENQFYQNITANQVRNNNGQFGVIPFSICDQKCILGKQTCFKFRIISNKQDGIYLGICDKNTLYLDKYCKSGHNWAQNEDKHGVYMIDTGLKSLGKSKSYNDFDPYFNDSDQVPFEFYGEEEIEIGVQVDLIENIIYFRKINGRKSGFEYAMPINKMNRSWLYPCVAMYNSYSIVQIFPYQW